MIVVVVLVIAWLVFRLAGSFGASRLDGWVRSLPFALAAMFLFTAVAHFNFMRHELVKMVPPWVPYPMETVYFTGLLEALGAVGLMLRRTRRAAGIVLILFLLAVLPANIYAAVNDVPFAGRAPSPLWWRVPLQAIFIGLLWVGAFRQEHAPGNHDKIMGVGA